MTNGMILSLTILLFLGITVGCLDQPLTPGHRPLEGDIWVLKLDSDGDQQWFTVIDSGKYDEAFSIIQTFDNGYAVAGSISDLNAFNPVPRAVRLNGQGSVLWDTIYQTPTDHRGTDIAPAGDEGFAVACSQGLIILTSGDGHELHRTDLAAGGEYWAIAPSSGGGWIAAGRDHVVKIDRTGTVQWQKQLGGISPDSKPIIVPYSQGGFLVAGQSMAPFVTVARFDALGTPIWNTTLGGRSYMSYLLSTARQYPDGGYGILAGFTDTGSAGVEDTSLDENGEIIRQKEVNTSIPAIWTADGGYASVALTENDYGGARLRLEKLDGDGIVQWTSAKRLDEYSTVVALIQTSDGGFAVLGMYMKY